MSKSDPKTTRFHEGWIAWSDNSSDCPYPAGVEQDEWQKGWRAHAYSQVNKEAQDMLALPVGPVSEGNKVDLTTKLVLLIADMLTLPPDNDRIRQIFNLANELRRSVPSGEHEDYVRASNAVRAIAMRNAEK